MPGTAKVWITAAAFNYDDLTGKVLRVAVEKSAERAVVMLEADGNGMTFTAKKGLSLSTDRRNLVIRNEDDTGRLVYHRCPSRPNENGSAR